MQNPNGVQTPLIGPDKADPSDVGSTALDSICRQAAADALAAQAEIQSRMDENQGRLLRRIIHEEFAASDQRLKTVIYAEVRGQVRAILEGMAITTEFKTAQIECNALRAGVYLLQEINRRRIRTFSEEDDILSVSIEESSRGRRPARSPIPAEGIPSVGIHMSSNS